MLYCKHCGGKVIKNSRFCMNCCSPLDEQTIIDSTDRDYRMDNLHVENTESVDDFDEYAAFGIDIEESDPNLRPTFKEPRKGLKGLFEFGKKK